MIVFFVENCEEANCCNIILSTPSSLMLAPLPTRASWDGRLAIDEWLYSNRVLIYCNLMFCSHFIEMGFSCLVGFYILLYLHLHIVNGMKKRLSRKASRGHKMVAECQNLVAEGNQATVKSRALSQIRRIIRTPAHRSSFQSSEANICGCQAPWKTGTLQKCRRPFPPNGLTAGLQYRPLFRCMAVGIMTLVRVPSCLSNRQGVLNTNLAISVTRVTSAITQSAY